MSPLENWIPIEERAQGPAVADPEALFAQFRQRMAERRKRELPPPRSLAECRKSCHVSQVELAGRLGWKQSRLSKLESHSDPRYRGLSDFVAALGGSLVLLARFPERDVHLTLRPDPEATPELPPA